MAHYQRVLALTILLSMSAANARQTSVDDYSPTPVVAPSAVPGNGAIFQSDAGYAALTSGSRAARLGDIVTVILVERTTSTKSSSTSTARGGAYGLTPPATGPASFLKSSDVNISGDQSFKGKGESAQSNSLNGEISVMIAAVYPNGTMLVRGEKMLTLNRGDERVQLSGIIRAVDISADNKIASTRLANAKIRYVGKGDVASASKPGWLQRFFAKVSPF